MNNLLIYGKEKHKKFKEGLVTIKGFCGLSITKHKYRYIQKIQEFKSRRKHVI